MGGERRDPRSSVIVPAHNAAATLPTTLAAVAAQEIDGEYEVIVVDDGSTDATGRIAAEAGAHVVRNDVAAGPGRARNAGVAAATAEALAFTDADCAPTPGWLAAGLAALEDAGLVQGRVSPPPAVDVGPFDRTLWVTRPNGLFETANLFVRRDVFDRVGGFDDGLLDLAGAHFGEDIIFGWRARRAGVTTAFCEEAAVAHEVIPRGPGDYLRERRRLAYFCEMVRQVPELRGTFLHRRWFLTRRSAAFTTAVAALALAATARSPLPMLAAVPYARHLAADMRANRARDAALLAVGDALGFAALARGSARFRRVVL